MKSGLKFSFKKICLKNLFNLNWKWFTWLTVDFLSSSCTTGENDSCQLMSRKKRRGVIEKKRRDRINSSLSELKRLVPSAFEKQGSAKLEKAEILQLTVDHLKSLHAKGMLILLNSKSQKICCDSCWICPENVSHAPLRPCIQIEIENNTQKGNDSLCVHRNFSYEHLMFQPLSISESLFGLTFRFPQKFECKVKMQWRGLINNDGKEGR